MFMRSALDSSIALIVAGFISSVLVSMNFRVSTMSGLSEPKMTPSSKSDESVNGMTVLQLEPKRSTRG